MRCMFSTKRAKFLYFYSLGLEFLILCRRIISSLTSRAFELYKLSHRLLLQYLRDNSSAYGMSALADSESEFFFHGDGGDELG